jgi:UDP-N-acetylmuramoyl-L-alanyl-D-glutamate--2,6-diaminopimelate ligase
MIDYAHTPDGIENILRTVRGFAKGRVVILFGCGGDRDNTKRPIMGRMAGELADFCIVTSDNPRTEDPMGIIAMIEPAVKETGTPYVVIENRAEAIYYALDNAQKDDVIVLAGKGHETYQILNSSTIDFDEREIVKNHLKK